MRLLNSRTQPDPAPAVRPARLLLVIGSMLILSSVVLAIPPVAFCGAADRSDGGALFRKHCSVCHPDASSLRSVEDIAAFIRSPVPPMPAFGEDKLSDREAAAIVDYIRHGASVGRKGPEQETAPMAPPAEAMKPVAPAHPVESAAPVRATTPAKVRTERHHAESKPVKSRKVTARSFVGNWSVKGLRNDEVVTFQQFRITANANDELTVIPSQELADYAVKVTSAEVVDGALHLRLSWTWKNSPSYWKIETYELALSDDGRKLSGSYTVRASGGQNMTWSVWGE